ncbi:MAG: choice-of-anchor R domain-containing protein, partial [Phycisphaerales bacterium]
MPDFTSIRSRRSVRLPLSLAAILAGASAAPADATVLIQNTAAAYTTGGSAFGGNDVKAYLFTTGSTAFDFGSIEILLTNTTPGTSVAVAAQFEIRAVSGGVPGSVLASSAVINTSVTQQYTWQTFTLTSAFTLAANTSYALVMTGPSLNSIVRWGNTNPS